MRLPGWPGLPTPKASDNAGSPNSIGYLVTATAPLIDTQTGPTNVFSLPANLVTLNTNNGAGLTNIPAGQLTGTVPLSAMNSAVLTNNNAGAVTFAGQFALTNSTNSVIQHQAGGAGTNLEQFTFNGTNYFFERVQSNTLAFYDQ